ncbi:MAG: hypothetical protein BWZ10_01044 [candidate division BRC1 bacterium ADurb.BinA364]|nr:MAG: hypothetical protein BWZ10_01044 [candidate division BRC1 bacterium ADurb.BinA364]
MGLRLRRDCIDAAQALFEEDLRGEMQRRSWAALPLLNELRRTLGIENPAAFYREHWGGELVCPGEGEYVWNEAWRTYESSAFGHPDSPKPGPRGIAALDRIQRLETGATFEYGGLRAKAALIRSDGR